MSTNSDSNHSAGSPRKKVALLALLLIATLISIGWILQDDPTSARTEKTGVAPATRNPSMSDSRLAREKLEREKAWLEEASKAAGEANKRVLAEAMANLPLTSVGTNGRVTTEAIEKLELTPEEIASLDQAFSHARTSMAVDFLERIRPLEATPTNSDRTVYYARARSDRGKEPVEALRQTLADTIGPDRAAQFTDAIHEYAIFGGFGKYDIQIEIPNTDDPSSVYVEYINPGSGRASSYGEYTRREFDESFGNLISSLRERTSQR